MAGALVAAHSTAAFADLTGFVGLNTTPSNREALGGAFGVGLLIVGFEFEYAYTPDDPASAAPSLTTAMGNLLLQTPVEIAGFQPYVTVGGGVYHESLGAHDDTDFGSNVGGGVKFTLIGPIRLRVDYRIFRLGSGALYSPAHRVYVGLNLKL